MISEPITEKKKLVVILKEIHYEEPHPKITFPNMTEPCWLLGILTAITSVRWVGVEIRFSHLRLPVSSLKLCLNTNVAFPIFHSSNTKFALHIGIDV